MAFLAAMPQASAQFYYGTLQTFGKNRVQFNDFNWTFYRFERFDVYFYTGGRPIAQKAAYMMEEQLRRIERDLESTFDDRIQLLVFNSLTDLKQSNLNVEADDAESNVGGILRTKGSKMFVYFDGDYVHLEEQIRSGLAELAVSHLIYGGFVNNLRNSAFLSLPDWYLEGLIAHIAHPWSPEVDQRVMDGFRTNKYKRFNALTGNEAKYAGQSMWYYLTQTYGEGVIKNLVFLTIINRSVSSGFEYVLGQDLPTVEKSWRNFFLLRYGAGLEKEPVEGQKILRAKGEQRIDGLTQSGNGRYLAYQTNRLGEYAVYVMDLEKNRKRRIHKKGFKIAENTDLSYPLMAWHPNNRILAFITEDKGFIWLHFHDLQKKKTEKRKLFGFQKVLSFTYSSDGKEFLMSAVKDGRSDIFIYTIVSTTIERITDDDFTDLQPAYINNDQQIVFASNRTHDSLTTKEPIYRFNTGTNLFVFDRRKPKESQKLWRLTHQPAVFDMKPQEYGNGTIGYLSNLGNGIQNQYVVTIDSFVAYVDTVVHYDYNFKRYQLDPVPYHQMNLVQDLENDHAYTLVFRKNRYEIYRIAGFDKEKLRAIQQKGETSAVDAEREPMPANAKPLTQVGKDFRSKFEINLDDYELHPDLTKNSGKKVQVAPSPVAQLPAEMNMPEAAKAPEKKEISFPSTRNYQLTFFRDDFSVELNNAFLNPQYQPFTGRPTGQLLNPGFNMFTKVGAVDLMNDYRLTLGFRTDFQPISGLSISPNSEVILLVDNTKKRLNQGYSFFRRSQVSAEDLFFRRRFLSYQANYIMTWPFNEVTSIRGTFGYRHDRNIPLSDAPANIIGEITTTNYGIGKVEYVYDNTIKRGLNLFNGTRYKVFAEYYHNFDNNNGGMWTAGLDYRKYTRVHGPVIWANRLAFGTSFGPEKLVYFLGGVDNQFRPSFNEETPISQTENYRFQTLATNMRGFFQNTRNGNNFGVINSELRIPVFRYLMNRPLRSDFFTNFQVVPFVDLGTAWNGSSPYDPQNAINNEVITSGPGSSLTIILNKQRDPFVLGYGVGLRSRLLGYFLRVDWAYGIEDRIILPRVFYFSIGTDF